MSSDGSEIVYRGPCTNCGGSIHVTAAALVYHSQPLCGKVQWPPEDVAQIEEIIKNSVVFYQQS